MSSDLHNKLDIKIHMQMAQQQPACGSRMCYEYKVIVSRIYGSA